MLLIFREDHLQRIERLRKIFRAVHHTLARAPRAFPARHRIPLGDRHFVAGSILSAPRPEQPRNSAITYRSPLAEAGMAPQGTGEFPKKPGIPTLALTETQLG